LILSTFDTYFYFQYRLLSVKYFRNEQLDEALDEIKNGDAKQLRIIQLENSILQEKKRNERETGKLRVAHRNEMQSIDVQMSMLRREADQRVRVILEQCCRRSCFLLFIA
jgi:hypothetical protein